MATIYLAMILPLSYSIMMITSRSASAVPECSQSHYLPSLGGNYRNDRIVPVMDGQSVTISCTILCPSSNENLNDCSEDIRPDWMIIDLSEDKTYRINAGSDRNEFLIRFEIDDEMIEFSDLDFEQCSLNEISQFNFNLTFHNFTSSLIVICGLMRTGADYHLMEEYARLKPKFNSTVNPTTMTACNTHEPTTSSTVSSTSSTSYSSPAVVGYGSKWPDKASFPVTGLLSAVCILLTLLTAVFIICNIKLQRQLRDTIKKDNAQARHTSHTHMNSNNHYDAFPKHLWQTAVVIGSSNDSDLW